MTRGEVLLEKSRHLTDRIMKFRRKQEVVRKGVTSYGDAADYIKACRERDGVIAELRGMCRVVVDNT